MPTKSASSVRLWTHRHGTSSYDLGMSRMGSESTRSLALGAVIGSLVTLLLPWLTGTTGDAPLVMVLTALALMTLSALRSHTASGGAAARAAARIPTDAAGAGDVLAGRPTDAPHHPLRPRAPGLV